MAAFTIDIDSLGVVVRLFGRIETEVVDGDEKGEGVGVGYEDGRGGLVVRRRLDRG